MFSIHEIFWAVFVVVFVAVFCIDMFVTDHRKEDIRLRTALTWSGIWICTALAFGAAVYFFYPEGNVRGFEFLASYLVEYSLSVDNLFVFILIFNVMGIAHKHQPRILKWGIIGAVVMRIIFIVVGVQLLQKFQFVMYIFGVILVITAVKMLISKDQKIVPEKNLFVRLTSKVFKIKTDDHSGHFFVKNNGTRYATLALVTLVLVESTDLIFAVDSIPAVLSITRDSFVAITSNLFAILGLRSLFFALSGVLQFFRFLKYGISVILLFIGVKMLLAVFVHVPVQVSLLVIVGLLAVSILASVIIKDKTPPTPSC